MKKTYQFKNLGCANCAAKMERGILKLDGVNDAKVNFMMQKLTLDAEDSRFEDVLQSAIKLCRKIEPDCKILV